MHKQQTRALGRQERGPRDNVALRDAATNTRFAANERADAHVPAMRARSVRDAGQPRGPADGDEVVVQDALLSRHEVEVERVRKRPNRIVG
jgi:hypothetical protein